MLEPPLSGPEEENAAGSELRIATPPPAAETGPADFDGPLGEKQSDEAAQVDPAFASGLAAVEETTETILPTIADETDLALASEPPETDHQVEAGPLELAAPPSTGPEDLAAFTGELAAIEEETETILFDLETIAAETRLALAAEHPVADQQVEADPAQDECSTAAESEEAPAARITALEAELAAAEEHSRQLRSQVAVLEGELDAARLTTQTATAERGAAEATALTALARVEELERELALARAGNGTLRSESDVVRAEKAFGRLTEIEERLAAVSAHMAALRALS